MEIRLTGIDPGIVHTGIVSVALFTGAQIMYIQHRVLAGIDGRAIEDVIAEFTEEATRALTFVEKYRPRSNFNLDKEMIAGERTIKDHLPYARFINTTGIKTVVKPELLRRLQLDKFKTPTHHGDLVSAARILLLGALKEDDINERLATIASFPQDYKIEHL